MAKEVSDNDAVLDAIKQQTEAIKELTTQVASLVAAWEKWRKAGKF
jgi:hypothetical protein